MRGDRWPNREPAARRERGARRRGSTARRSTARARRASFARVSAAFLRGSGRARVGAEGVGQRGGVNTGGQHEAGPKRGVREVGAGALWEGSGGDPGARRARQGSRVSTCSLLGPCEESCPGGVHGVSSWASDRFLHIKRRAAAGGCPWSNWELEIQSRPNLGSAAAATGPSSRAIGKHKKSGNTQELQNSSRVT